MSKQNSIDKLMKRGYKKYQYGEYKEAFGNFNQATALAQGNNLIKEECIAIKMEATALYRLARYREAEEKYYLALKIAFENGFKEQECRIYNHLIGLHEMQNNYDKAKSCINKGYNLSKELKDDLSIAKILNSKGVYYHLFGNDEDALECYKEALVLYEKIENERGLATTSNLIAGYYYLNEKYNKALKYYEKAYNIGKEIQDFNIIALSTCRSGLIYNKRGKTRKALELLKEPVFLKEKIENKKIIVEVFNTKAHIYKSLKNYKLALDNFKKSEELAEELGNDYIIVKNKMDLGAFYYQIDDLDNSFIYIKESLDILNIISKSIEITEMLKQIKELYEGLPEFLWLISEISPQYKDKLDLEEIKGLRKDVFTQCKTCQKIFDNIQVRFEIKIKSKHILKFLDNLIKENQTQEEEIKNLKAELEQLKEELEKIIDDPFNYTGIDDNKLKNFLNTTKWKKSEEILKKKYFKGFYNKLDDNSKVELTLMLTMLELLKQTSKICAFLLTKAVERELRLKVFNQVRDYWELKLKMPRYNLIDNSHKYKHLQLDIIESIKKSSRDINYTFLNFLEGRHQILLGKVPRIFKEVRHFCSKNTSKLLFLGWEQLFCKVFNPIEICKYMTKIIDSFEVEIVSFNNVIKFKYLRGLVAHPSETDKNYINRIDFNEKFIEEILKFLTIKKPRLLKIVCEIEPV